MKVRIKLMHERAVLPVRRPGDSGADLYAIHACTLYPGQIERVSFGFALELDEWYEAQIRPRSGLSSRGFVCALGTVDSAFRGEVGAVLVNLSRDDKWEIKPGDRVCQMVIAPIALGVFEAVSELTPTARGANGFGSTGR